MSFAPPLLRRVATTSKRCAARYPKLGFALYATSLQYFVVQVVVAYRWSPPYSLSANTISDLGNTVCGRFNDRAICSPLHQLMNLSFVTLGVTMVAGSLLINFCLPARRGTTRGLSAMSIAGIGVLLVGLFPENTVSALHGFGASLPFTVGNVAVVSLGFTLPLSRPFRYFSIFAGSVSLVALVFYVGNHDWGLGEGGMERVVAYPQTVWLVVIGIYFLLTSRMKELT